MSPGKCLQFIIVSPNLSISGPPLTVVFPTQPPALTAGECRQRCAAMASTNTGVERPVSGPGRANSHAPEILSKFWKTVTGRACLFSCLSSAKLRTSCLQPCLCCTIALLMFPSTLSWPAFSTSTNFGIDLKIEVVLFMVLIFQRCASDHFDKREVPVHQETIQETVPAPTCWL